MSNDNKTDLSDLKARLGLKKPAAKSSGGPSSSTASSASKSSGPQTTIPRPDKNPAGSGGFSALKKSTESGATATLDKPAAATPRSSASAAQPAQPAAASRQAQPAAKPAPRPGPPPGAMGPPPTARAKKEEKPSSPDPLSKAANEQVDLKDLGIKEDVGLGLSAPIVALLVVLLVVGLFFGFMFAQSSQVRQLETRRIEDAQAMQTYLEPRLDALTEALGIIESLQPGVVDYDAAEQLAALDFAIGAQALPNNRILLGRQIVGPLNEMSAQTNLLREKVRVHNQATQNDRDDIEALQENQREQLSDEGRLGIVFDFAQIAAYNQDPENYTLPTARVVAVTDTERDDEGMIGIKAMYRGHDDRRVQPLVVMYLEEGDLLLSEGENALDRYNRRVRALRESVEEIRRRIEPLQTEVAAAANADAPSLLSLSASDEEYTEEDGSAEAAPAPAEE